MKKKPQDLLTVPELAELFHEAQSTVKSKLQKEAYHGIKLGQAKNSRWSMHPLEAGRVIVERHLDTFPGKGNKLDKKRRKLATKYRESLQGELDLLPLTPEQEALKKKAVETGTLLLHVVNETEKTVEALRQDIIARTGEDPGGLDDRVNKKIAALRKKHPGK